MRVIFLDVDGVLNCRNRWESLPQANSRSIGSKVDPDAVIRLRAILEATGAKIVVSSTWRHFFMRELTEFLHHHGVNRDLVVGQTPYCSSGHRGEEIQRWLTEHPEVNSFVILDDDSDVEPFEDRLVQTTWEYGLLDGHVPVAIDVLRLQ